MDDETKHVDENWKNQIDKEKNTADEQKETYHTPTFTIFLSSLAMQAMIAMGKLENPVTGKSEVNLEQARFLIDTIDIISAKTKGNLTKDEESLVNDALYNLRMLYLQGKDK
jgi:hypothetical protein